MGRKFIYILALLWIPLLLYPTVHAQKLVVKSIDELTPQEFQKLLKWDPRFGGYRFLPVAPLDSLERHVEPPRVQDIILAPLKVEEGPQFVRPQEIFRIRVTFKNKDNIAYQIAILKRPEPSLLDRLKSGWNWLKNQILRLFGVTPEEPKTVNETWEIIPIYYLVAALDPKEIRYLSGNKVKVLYPGGLYEVKPGYGCFDIVLGNEYQFSLLVKNLKEGKININDVFCGQIEKGAFGIPKPNTLFGPITMVLPVELYKEGGQLGQAVVQVKGDEVVGIIKGCTDKGDGRTYVAEFNIGGETYRITIPSKPGDCILTPGESMEFVVYGFVNPVPSGMIPPESAAEVITTLYTEPEKADELIYKYPGAIHELYLFLGTINNKDVGITWDDIKQSIGSFVTVASGALLGWTLGGPFGMAIGVAAGLFVNWLATGSIFKLPVIDKFWQCIVSGKCIYEVTSLKTIKTYIVIAQPQFQVTLQLEHLGLIALMVALGGYLGYRAARVRP